MRSGANMDILSSREWAILSWVLLATVYFSRSSKRQNLKEPLRSLLKALFSRHIVSAVVLMGMYVGLSIYVLSFVGLWDSSQIKNTIVWYFTVATFSLFRLEHFKAKPRQLRDTVLDNLKLVGIIEYLVGNYTFHIAVELILVPVLFILGCIVAFAEAKPEYQQAHKFLNGLLVIIGLSILGATFYLMFADFGKVASRDGVYDFFVPPLLTVAYTPFIAFMVIYSTYQTVLIMLRYSIKSRSVELYARFVALLLFNFRIGLLERWASNVALRNIASVSEVNQSIRQIFAMVAREKNPPTIERSEGWSPYKAKDYLLSEGVETRHYHPVDPVDGTEWFCCSSLIEFGEGVFPNNIAFYLNGNERAITSLKLKLNVNAPEYASDAHAKLLSLGNVLMRKALGLELVDMLEKTIMSGVEGTIDGPDFKIEISKNIWPNHASSGYDLGLELSGI